MTVRVKISKVKKQKLSKSISEKVSDTYDFHGVHFRESISKLLKNGRYEEIIDLTESFLLKYPMERRYVISAYNKFQVLIAGSKFGREIARLYVETSNKILDIGTNLYGLPPMFEEYWAFSRFGELIEQTAFVHFMKQLNPGGQRPVICLSPGTKIINTAFVPYMVDNFDVVTDPKEVAHIQSIKHLAPYPTFFYKFSETQYGHTSLFLSDIYKTLSEKKINQIPFKLKEVTTERALNFLKTVNVNDHDNFVVLHLREDGFVTGADHHKLRNSNPLDYMEAIKWLCSSGFKVIRIGHEHMTPLPQISGLIDLTASSRPPEVDIYLCAQAKFYYGSLSGPVGLTAHFGVPRLLTNVNYYSFNYPGALIQLAPVVDEKTQRFLNIKEIEGLGLSTVTAYEPFERNNLSVRFRTSEDHVRSVKEMVEYLEGGNIYKLNQDRKQCDLGPKMLSDYTSDSFDMLDLAK